MDFIDKLRKRKAKSREKKTLREEVKEENSPKSFEDDWKTEFELVKKWAFIPSYASIISTSLVFVAAFPNLHWILAVMIGLPIAWIYEQIKNRITSKAFLLYYRDKNAILMPVAVLFIMGSNGLSVFGTYQAYMLLEGETKQDVMAVSSFEKTSKIAEYDTLISEAKREATQYKEDNLVLDMSQKIVLRSSATKTHNELVSKISELQKEKRDALAKLEQNHGATLSEAVDDLGAYLYLLIGLAVFWEVLIISASWFYRYYRHRVFVDEATLYDDSEEINIPLNQISSVVKYVVDMVANGGGLPAPTVPPAMANMQMNYPPPVKVKGFGPQEPDAQLVQQPMQPPVQNTPPPIYQTIVQQVPELHKCGNPACDKLFKKTVPHKKFCSEACGDAVNNFHKIKRPKKKA